MRRQVAEALTHNLSRYLYPVNFLRQTMAGILSLARTGMWDDQAPVVHSSFSKQKARQILETLGKDQP